MKKFVATFAALAVVGAAGVMYVNEKMETNAPDEQSTTSPTYVQTDSGYSNKVTTTNKDVTSTSTTTQSTTEKIKDYTFKAEIDTVSGTSLTLKVKSGDGGVKAGDKIIVSFDNVKTVDSDGDTVKADDVANFKNAVVTYDGTVMETYPLQVKAAQIMLTDRTDCNVYFCLPDGEVIDTVRVPVGATLDSADMPNAGAYCDDGYHFEGWQLNGATVYGVADIEQSISLVAKIRKD